ncbi:MAG TPA: enoyl-CoA hydratase [Bryobacteraceae bacterium]|nr:enoyl-CoA hydratase [Bryobacteraceae bacterium]
MPPASIEVRVDRPTGIAFVTIHNERKLNTLNSSLLEKFALAVEGLAGDETLRAAVLSGAGERAFIGGADVDEMVQLDAISARAFIGLLHRCCDALRSAPFPVIARMMGYTLGAGLELAAACDLRVAAETAVFGMPEVKLGIPSVVEAALLPTLIGWGRTRRLLLLGETITAAEAADWGLVEMVVPARDLDRAVEGWTASLLQAGPRAVRLQKALIRRWEDLPLSEAIRTGIDAFSSAWETDEPNRMMKAFLARRKR